MKNGSVVIMFIVRLKSAFQETLDPLVKDIIGVQKLPIRYQGIVNRKMHVRACRVIYR